MSHFNIGSIPNFFDFSGVIELNIFMAINLGIILCKNFNYIYCDVVCYREREGKINSPTLRCLNQQAPGTD